MTDEYKNHFIKLHGKEKWGIFKRFDDSLKDMIQGARSADSTRVLAMILRMYDDGILKMPLYCYESLYGVYLHEREDYVPCDTALKLMGYDNKPE